MMGRRPFLCALAALGAGVTSGRVQAAGDLTVFAAASLRTAFDAAGAAWMKASGRRAVISYAATSALARQIEQGAPAHIFASADLDWMDYLVARRLVAAEEVTKLLGSAMVLVAPAASKAEITIEPGFAMARLLGEGRLAMADVRAVPAGRYGKAALESLGVWDEVAGHVVQADNVSAALKLVALGEAAFGIVYASDARAEPAVRVLATFPAGSHPPVIYAVAPVVPAVHADTSSFLAFLVSPAAAALFTGLGFTVLAPAATP